MNERTDTDTDSDAAGDEAVRDDDPMDKYDDAVIAADATGMLAGERLITQTEIAEGLGDSPSE
ncbi:MAG TPA: hypothetical protein VGD01_02085 [Candidatus Elarobacter sp.]|jgi:hypothetical protein